ncbi:MULTISPECIES: TetR/AcrR family transcriptional regulator [unclassified Paenibacillus]|uniref:TetR/AcrR family transcriptional regulator n=1 Tax=unclassified Paenibacillus TaxID=185978 RepID=UPI001AE4FC4A|nr:AcrR family transcriptional regulator [Paenibacillus sp. PvP091]MBP1170004.1 AcrR family transcriptional regulator [Paenibacillus sp. PvR098]MBP2441032.1 AcrR family transcriptional regulator [Paenibacillus sp. PvP052]
MGADKRDKIIESALKLFEEKGYHSTKISDIVQDAGMAKGTFYLYFKSKEDMFRHVAEACLDEIVGALAEGSSETDGSFEDRMLYRIIRQTLIIYYDNRTILNIINQHGSASPEIGDISKHFYGKMATVIKGILAQYQAYPGYTDEQLEMTAYAKIGMVEMAAYQWFIEKKCGSEHIDLLTEVLVGVNINCKPRTDVNAV